MFVSRPSEPHQAYITDACNFSGISAPWHYPTPCTSARTQGAFSRHKLSDAYEMITVVYWNSPERVALRYPFPQNEPSGIYNRKVGGALPGLRTAV